MQREYLSLPPVVQRVSRDLYLQAFKGLDLDNADQYLPLPEDFQRMLAEDQAAQQAAMAQAGAQGAPVADAPSDAPAENAIPDDANMASGGMTEPQPGGMAF
jgi:hypothetical protein